MNFKKGDLIGIPCTIQNGPFPDEKLVTVETTEGQIAGFVKLANLKVLDDEHGLVKAVFVSSSGGMMQVQLFGSFFTTALGMAQVPQDRIQRYAVA